MKTITIGSIKGGTGKTSALILLARAVARAGRRVLLIDLDVNDSLSSVLKPKNIRELDPLERKHVAAALLSVKDDFADYVVSSNYQGIDLMRNHLQLSRVNFTQNLLSNKIKASDISDRYDYVMIDTPATYHALHIMAYQAADLIITPINPAKFDLHPLHQLAMNIEDDCGKGGAWRLFYNRVKADSARQDEYLEMFGRAFAGRIFDARIPDTQKVRESIDRRTPVGRGREWRKLRQAVCALASEVADMEIDPDTEENF